MDAVGIAAGEMIAEIRRQFRENPGILEGTVEPDSDKCIDIASAAATKRMVLPALLAVGTPLVASEQRARSPSPAHSAAHSWSASSSLS